MNCRRLAFAHREECIAELGEQYAFDIIALQEISIYNDNSSTDIDICYYNGHGLIIFPPKAAAPAVGFLVHRSWVPYVSVGSFGHRCGCLKVYLDCGLAVTCISGHCEASPDMADFERCLEALDVLIPGPKGGPVLIGIDANAVLGIDSVGQDDRFEVLGPCRVGVADARGRLLSSWLSCRGLVASSTFSCQSESFETRIPDEHEFFSDILPSQIDYIISDYTTHINRHKATYIDPNISEIVCSDHFGVACDFSLRSCEGGNYLKIPHAPKAPQKYNTWSIDAENLPRFQKDVSVKIMEHTDLNNLNEDKLASLFHEVAAMHGRYYNSRFDPGIAGKIGKTAEESALLDARKQATTRADRAQLTKQLWKLRKRERRLLQETHIANLFNDSHNPHHTQR